MHVVYETASRPVDPLLTMRSGTVAVGCHRLPIGLFERFPGSPICHWLPPVAPAGLHKCSTLATACVEAFNNSDTYAEAVAAIESAGFLRGRSSVELFDVEEQFFALSPPE